MMNLRLYSNQGEMQMYDIEIISADETTSKDYDLANEITKEILDTMKHENNITVVNVLLMSFSSETPTFRSFRFKNNDNLYHVEVSKYLSSNSSRYGTLSVDAKLIS